MAVQYIGLHDEYLVFSRDFRWRICNMPVLDVVARSPKAASNE